MTKNEIRHWGQRLEAGQSKEPLLALAGSLAQSRVNSVQADKEFKTGLRARLLNTATPKASSRALAPIAMGLAVIAALWLALRVPQPASAAELLDRANVAYASYMQSGGILHTEFVLSTFEGRPQELHGESWLAGDEGSSRVELRDSRGRLVYFAQRNGETLWRSMHDLPIEAPIEALYRLGQDEYELARDLYQQLHPGLEWPPFFGDLAQWIELDTWFSEQAVACQDLYCLLGIDKDMEWDCQDKFCTLPLLETEVLLTPLELVAQFLGTEKLANGQEVYVVELGTNLIEGKLREMKFATDDFSLVEVTAYSTNHPHPIARLRVTVREQLPVNALSFDNTPSSLQIIDWAGQRDLLQVPLGMTNGSLFTPLHVLALEMPGWVEIRFHLEEGSPPSGSQISGSQEIVVSVNLDPPLPEDAELVIQLCASSPQLDYLFTFTRNCFALGGIQLPVATNQQSVETSFQVNVTEEWPEHISLMIGMESSEFEKIYVITDVFWTTQP